MKNIWDKVSGFITPYAADEEYEDGYDDEMEDGFAEEEESTSVFGNRRNQNSRRERRAATSGDENEYTESETGSNTASAAASVSGFSSPITTGFTGHVVNGSAGNKQQLVLVRPETFNDAPIIAANLREKRAIVLNLDNVDKALARRVVDFLSGCTYAVDGSVKKVAHATYLFCPSNMEVTGDLTTLAGEAESYV